MRAIVGGVAFAIGLAAAQALPAAEATREVHGASDAVALPGVAIAWGVLRAANEDETAAVLRIEPDTAVYAWLEIVGRDPFTQRAATVFPAVPVAGTVSVKVPRARFADYPRTEIRLWRAGSAPPSPPELAVYFAGVPDTTPEATDAADLARSLATRLARARADLARRPP